MNIKGRLVSKSDTILITDVFKKREFVIEYAENPEYPEVIKFELIQDKCSLLDNLSKNQDLDVYFNIKGRAWNDPKSGETKYFNSLQAWKIDAGQKPVESNEEEIDDLPW